MYNAIFDKSHDTLPVEQPHEADEEQEGEDRLHEEHGLLITADLGGKKKLVLRVALDGHAARSNLLDLLI